MSALEDEGVRAMVRRIASLEQRLILAEAQLAGIAAGNVCWKYQRGSNTSGLALAGQEFANTVRHLAGEVLKLAKTDEDRERLGYCRSLVEGNE